MTKILQTSTKKKKKKKKKSLYLPKNSFDLYWE